MIKFYQDNRKTLLRVPFNPPTCFTTYQGYQDYHVRNNEHTIIIAILYFKASNVMLMYVVVAAVAAADDGDSNALLINSYNTK